MATNLRTAYVSGSGALLDTQSGTTITDTRIRGFQATGVGKFLVTQDTGPKTNITFVISNLTGQTELDLGDGVRFDGVVRVSAPTSSSFTAFYG